MTNPPWSNRRSLSSPSSAEPPDHPAMTIPSNTTGLEYTSEPFCVVWTVRHRSLPVLSSSATTDGFDVLDTVKNTRPPSTAPEESMLPFVSILVCHTIFPVSALSANAHPPLDPTKTQPSDSTGVPVKSPLPPVENAQACWSVAAWTVPI